MERKRSVRRQRRYNKPFAKKCKNFFRKFVAFMFSNVGIIGLVVGYTMMGAVIFKAIEGKGEHSGKTYVIKSRIETAMRIWNLTKTLNVLYEEQYKIAVTELIKKHQELIVNSTSMGYDGSTDDIDYSQQWTFSGAFLYSLTVITTIGYGNIYPRTIEGKITTIIYAIIGMPLFLLYLSNIGDIMARSFKWIYANCCLCRWCPEVAKKREERRRQRVQQLQQVSYGSDENGSSGGSHASWQENANAVATLNREVFPSISEQGQEDEGSEGSEGSYDPQTVTVPVTICLAIMTGYICGGAVLFSKWEGWPYLEGSYFCFISLSTIGFGDIVPGNIVPDNKGSGQIGFIFCSMYLMLGMALIAMCFNLMQEEVIHKIRTTIRTIKYMLGCNR